MDNKKFEQLIELIINEDEDQARSLFHDIVVEKSREIYESMMDDEMEEGMGGQVGDLLDDITAEEQGMTEDDESEDDLDIEMDDEVEMSPEDEPEEMGGEEELEDRVVDLEDKLDQLMAEFEDIMGGEDEEGEDMDMDMDADEEGDMDMDSMSDEEVMEAVQLQKVSLTSGDNGNQTKSSAPQNSGQAGMDSRPVKFSGFAETDPKGPKGATNAYAKGETQVKGAGQFKNAPGHKSQDLASAPKPKLDDDGANTKSPVAESRRITKKRI
jgi:hypothetical protein